MKEYAACGVIEVIVSHLGLRRDEKLYQSMTQAFGLSYVKAMETVVEDLAIAGSGTLGLYA